MQPAPHEIVACSFSAWYPTFQHLTFRSEVLPLPPGFADFLVRDGVFVRSGTSALPRRGLAPAEHDGSDEEAYRDWQEDESPPASPNGVAAGRELADEFAGFLADVEAVIGRLGGTVFPKLNWSAPKDAVWLKPSRDIACRTSDESSDRIAHDICDALPRCVGGHPGSAKAPELTLVLRQWRALAPGREFRCFVAGGDLVGVSQRDVTEHFPALADEQDNLAEALLAFHEENVHTSGFALADYTYDVYVTPKGTVRLVDLNPVGGTTSPLLFDWAELPYQHRTHGAAQQNGIEAHPQAAAADSAPLAAEAQRGRRQPTTNEHTGPTAAETAVKTTTIAPTDAVDVSCRTPGIADLQNGADHQGDTVLGAQMQSNSAAAVNCGAASAAGSSAGGVDAVLPLDFRIVTEPIGLQPASALYGVPYDLIDQSTGSALAELMRLTT